MKLSIKAGATSQSVNIFIQDSSSTVGAGLSGLVFNASGLIAYYTFTGASAAATAITLATLAAVGSAYSSGGFKEIDATNMKGLYRLDIPNAAIAAGNGRCVTIMLGGAANMAPLALEIELTGWDNQDAVHGGLSSLPNTAVTTNASLLTSGTGTDQLSVTSGRIDVGKLLGTAWLAPGVAGTPDVNAKLLGGTAQTGRDVGASVLLSAGTGTGQLDFTSGVVKANATQWLGGTIPAVNVTGVPLIDLKYTLGTISPATAGSVRADAVTGAVGSVTGAVGSVTGNVGGTLANLAAGAKTDVENAVWDATMASHVGAGSTGNKLNAAASAGDPWSTPIPGAYGAGTAGHRLGNVPDAAYPSNFAALGISAGGHISNVDTLTTYTGNTVQTADVGAGVALTSGERNSVADAILNRDMSVGTDSGSPTVRTVRQALRFLRNKWSIAAGTLTVTKEDDATASWTSAVTTDGTAQPIVSNDPAGP